KVADRLVAVAFGNLPHREEVVFALGHLLVVDVQETVVHPVTAKSTAVRALALRNLVFMVRKDQVLPAAVQVNRLAKVLAGHRAALNMPARAAVAPGAVPEWLAGFGCF